MADLEAFRHHPAASIRLWILQQARGVFRNGSPNAVDDDFMNKEIGVLFGNPGYAPSISDHLAGVQKAVDALDGC